MSTVYLITGANRGLGLGFVSTYASRSNHIVIAAVRDPFSASSKALSTLPTGSGSKVLMVKIDSKSETDAGDAAAVLKSAGISHVDVMIANAGICTDYSRVDQVPLSVLREHVDVNVYGSLTLYKSFYSMLVKSQSPKFVAIGSPLGSLTAMDQRPYPSAAYGPSKAMLHWFVRKISFENPEITSLIVDPGFVKTDMGNTGARANGMVEAFTEISDSVGGMVAIIDRGTREKEGLVISTYDNTVFPF